jgi:hypothetical protein
LKVDELQTIGASEFKYEDEYKYGRPLQKALEGE